MMPTVAVFLAQRATSAPPEALRTLLLSPLLWALVLGAVGLWLMVIGPRKWPRRGGAVLGGLGLLLLLAQLPRAEGGSLTDWAQQITFWILAGMAVASAAAVITLRSPVYSAVSFAVTLLAVSGLLLVQGAQFLGVATMAVYAGAILVTFLFVIMLAQPEGFAFYDRLSWGNSPAAVAVAASLTFAAGATYLIAGQLPLDGGPRQGGLGPGLRERIAAVLPESADDPSAFTRDRLAAARMIRPRGSDRDVLLLDAIAPAEEDPRQWAAREARALAPLAAEALEWEQGRFVVQIETRDDIRARQHVARLGGNLFSRYLVAIQAAGVLLLAALVGAVAIASQGHDQALPAGDSTND